MAYRGRALIELETVLDEMPQTPVEDVDTDSVLRVQVVAPTLSLSLLDQNTIHTPV